LNPAISHRGWMFYNDLHAYNTHDPAENHDDDSDQRCLYLTSFSCLMSGSRVFWIPSRVLLTASVTPIIGFSTAIGTARMTARTGPCRRREQ
jgi:hypothetical protein